MSKLAWAALSLAGLCPLAGQTEKLVGGVNFFRDFTGLQINAIATDASGAVIVGGTTTQPGLPVTPDAFQKNYRATSCGISPGPGGGTPNPCADVYVARIGADGTLLFATYFGSSAADSLTTLAAGPAGEIYLLGTTMSTTGATDDFSIPLETPILSPRPTTRSFLIQLRGGGPTVGFGRILALGDGISPAALSVDRFGNIYLAGSAFAGSLATTPAAVQTVGASGQFDGFVMKLDARAQHVIYATYLGGSSQDAVTSMAVDDLGNAYLAGNTRSADFPVTPGAWSQVAPGGPLQSSIFVSVLDSSGQRLLASARFGGESTEDARRIALSGDGNVLLAGNTMSAQFPVTEGAFQTQRLAGTTAFLAKFPRSLSHPVFATYIGGEVYDSIDDLIALADGSAILAGYTVSRFFPVTSNALERCNRTLASTLGAGFLVHMSAHGGLTYSSFFNTSDSGSILKSAALTPDDRVILAGQSDTYDLGYYGGPASHDNVAQRNFVFRLDADATPDKSRFCVVSAASFLHLVSNAGQLITLLGPEIGPSGAVLGRPDTKGLYPTALGGTRVLVNGQPTALLYAGKDQVNAWLPPLDPAAASARVEVEVDGAIRERDNVRQFALSPGFFREYGTPLASAINEDGFRNSREHPARQGGKLTLYATGLGPTQPPLTEGRFVRDRSMSLVQTPQIIVNFTAADVLFAGAFGAPGLIEIEIRVPSISPGVNLYPINVAVGSDFELGNVSVWVQ